MSSKLTILHGDNRSALRSLPDNSVDSVVTDPPYGLSKEPDMAEVLRHWLAGDDYTATGGGFMGKTWDSFVPGPATWKEVYRVLKPGGYVLSFSGTRTFDMATLALRLAGFEVRDCLSWMYGQGFPKSMDVSKAIDKAAGATREVIGSVDVGPDIRGGNYENASGRMVADITEPATDEAKMWEGWGTALKPAWEPIIVARKPLDGTVAANVLQWGTGAINIDGTRIGYRGDEDKASATPQGRVTSKEISAIGAEPDAGRNMQRIEFERPEQKGRFPANVMLSHTDECELVGTATEVFGGGSKGSSGFVNGYAHDGFVGNEVSVDVWECVDECPVKMLDDQSGTLKSGDAVVGNGKGARRGQTYAGPTTGVVASVYADTGGASRFFYNAKTSKSERNAGMPDGTVNDHPTVKPVAVMEWLIKLVTRPGGVVLDPFLGSGSTAVAAARLGTDCIGAEIDSHYIDIASHRAVHAGAEVERMESLFVDGGTVLPPVAEPESTPMTYTLRNFDE